jgi:transposase InsO family protein
LIRKMSLENPPWGAPGIHGELLKLGIEIGETSVGKYMVRHRKPPPQTWRTFLDNHLKSLVSVDFFTVPAIRFQILYAFLVLAHHRCRVLHFNVTDHPTAEWTAQQLRDAFPWDSASHYLLRDRDRIFGDHFTQQVKDMGIKQVLSAPRSPWQRAYCRTRDWDAPESRPVQPPEFGNVVAIPDVGGLHHRYERQAA